MATPSAPRLGSTLANGMSVSRSARASSRISSLLTGEPQRTLSTMNATQAMRRSR